MSNLEIGEWYRQRGHLGYFRPICGALDGYLGDFITNYSYIRKNHNIVNRVIHCFEPIKSLIPREALHLLAEGFVLKCIQSDRVFKLGKDGFVLSRDNDCKWHKHYYTWDFNDLTIAALPEGE